MTTICAIVDCGQPVLNKGYCRAHYRRLWKYGDPLSGGVARKPVTGKCSVEGCDNDMAKKGMCNAHYLRQRRYGRIELVEPSRSIGNHCKGECPGSKKLRAHMDYVANSDEFKLRAKKWNEENPEQYRARIAAYLLRDDVQESARLRTKKWAQANPEKKRAMDKAFTEANRALVTSYKAARRARVLQATPAWLTEVHWVEIRAVYAAAERLTRETKIKHEVDHIVPLQGKNVCGLHVPWNLRAIPKDKNNRRPRVWLSEHADTLDD